MGVGVLLEIIVETHGHGIVIIGSNGDTISFLFQSIVIGSSLHSDKNEMGSLVAKQTLGQCLCRLLRKDGRHSGQRHHQ